MGTRFQEEPTERFLLRAEEATRLVVSPVLIWGKISIMHLVFPPDTANFNMD